MEKDFKNLDQNECYKLFVNMRKHSEMKWRSSMKLKNFDKGTAISTQIVSVEELIKAFILFLDSKGMDLRKMENITTILQKNHSIRHFLGFVAFGINILMIDFLLLLKILRDDPNQISKHLSNKETIEIKAKWYFLRKIPLIKKEFYWFSQIERLRQEGNHFDLNPTSKSPLEINEEDFIEVNNRLKKVRNLIRHVIIIFEKDEDKMFNRIGTKVTEDQKKLMYTQMNEWIKSAVKTKGGIFRFVEKNSQGMQNGFFKTKLGI